MKQMIRSIILFFVLIIGTGNLWAVDIEEDNIIINVLPNSDAGTVEKSVSGRIVTITATPGTGYSVDAAHVIAEKMVTPPAAPRRAPGLSPSLPIEGDNPFTFTIPDGYDGAYVTVTFFKSTTGFTKITSLSQIPNDVEGLARSYELTADVDASGFSGLGAFTGTLDGGFHKIYNLSKPLFSSTNGAIVRNIIFEDVNISVTDGDGDAGAVTGHATGSSRIYNCGVLSSLTNRDDDGNITGFSGSSVSGSGNVGGIVGKISGTSRVINCYSYANITGGNNKGGIVGSNTVASNQDNITTMVMNCMFYGDIVDGGNQIAPIYGGTNINNLNSKGLNNYNYYRYQSRFSKERKITIYNCALAMEEKFINRFERYRLLLNSNKKLAAKYASTSTTVAPNDMAKWVLETADLTISDPQPFPVLKPQGKYPSIINYDAEHAPTTTERNKGGKLGTLIVNISGVGNNSPKDNGGSASITKSSLKLNRTDKDFDHFNYNYDKVQLPYYNDVGTGNYTKNRVVTGWEITGMEGDESKQGSFKKEDIWGGYNFADRSSYAKDLYSAESGDYSGRVFSQGAYFDVPDGVTSITIKPHWAVANYVSDNYYDVVYNKDYSAQSVKNFGVQYANSADIDIYGDGNKQKVYTSISNAISGFNNDKKSVYDQAVVLVGNVHQEGNPTADVKPYTVMSIDMNHDNEPDYSYIFGHNNRQPISPIRYDFLNVVGIAEAQKPNNTSANFRNVSIVRPKGWYEVTNTCVIHFSQFEYDWTSKSNAPVIFLGGTINQFVSTQSSAQTPGHTSYIHVGSNAWFAKFGTGTHSDGNLFTPHVPVSVTGGDYDEFYLSGTYQPDISNMQQDNAECYISGGHFGEMAGASLEPIDGDVRWDINRADITYFYGGGVNGNKPITGDIKVDIANSYVERYCGGPKFGDMETGKKVETNATDCTFGTFFGAGYGGNSYNRVKYFDEQDGNPADRQSSYTNDRGKYFNGTTTNANSSHADYGKKGKGVATDFDYEYFVWSTGVTGARFYVKFATFSLATTHNVTSNLKGCTVTGNFYGGGGLGKVDGTATSELDGCTVHGSVYGGGYSASIPKIPVRRTPAFVAGKEPEVNRNIGMFEMGEIAQNVDYEWKQKAKDDMPANGAAGTEDDKYVYTDADLTTLGEVGETKLTIKGGTTVGQSVYGGGEESGVGGNTIVKVDGGAIGAEGFGGAEYGNVYGGGKGKADNKLAGLVKGNTNVTISQAEGKTTKIYHNVYGGGAYGSVGEFDYDATTGMPTRLKENATGGNATVTIKGGTFGWNGKENGMIFGSSRGDVAAPGTDGIDPNDRMAWVNSTHVIIGDDEAATTPQVNGSVYGSGENGHVFQDTKVDVKKGTIGVTANNDTDGGARYPYRGNVYGGGCGTDTYEVDDDNDSSTPKKVRYNFMAGIVYGNTEVNITGGHVVHNVYGAGAMGSVGTFTPLDFTKHADYHTANPWVPEGKPYSCAEGTGLCTVNISGGKIGSEDARMSATGGPDDYGHVFAAGRGVMRDTTVYDNLNITSYVNNTDLTISDNAFICGSVYGGSESGHVLGNTKVTVTGGQIGCGFEKAGPYSDTDFNSESLEGTDHWEYKTPYAPYDQYAGESGYNAEGGAAIATDGHTFYGNVFGGGSGYYPYAPGKWLRSAGRVEGTTTVNVTGGHVLNNVYGGCEMADVNGSATVEISGGTVGVPRIGSGPHGILANPSYGYVFGGGMGDKRIFFNTSTNVNSTTVTITGGRIFGSVYGGGEDGHVLYDAVTTISEAEGKTTIIGSVGTPEGYDGNAFGGGQGSTTALTAGVVGGNATLNIEGGTLKGSAYGGGRIASVGTYFAMTKIKDEQTGEMVDNPLYGKMQDDEEGENGKTHGHLWVNLKGGTIWQDVYGGCMGTAEKNKDGQPQDDLGVSKTVEVHLNEGVGDNEKGCVVKGNIFGCNNVYSSPQGSVLVHIHGTQNEAEEATQIANAAAEGTEGEEGYKPKVENAKVKGRYDVKAVYGGGNLAAYKPIDATSSDETKKAAARPQVIIDGCGRTSIQQVYGGGNAASTPATYVEVNSAFEIEELFGGGNGKDKLSDGSDNPGANVGYLDYHLVENDPAFATKEARVNGDAFAEYRYGSGEASVNVYGGTIHRVFGGSNTKGNVRKTALTILEDQGNGCDLCIDEAYGGGKSAPMDAEAKLQMACIPGLKVAYGGAEDADIQGNVDLKITNGTFDRVFGGNNIRGTIHGTITVSVEETGCRPIIIGQLYGGGNQAPYTAPSGQHGPTVNVKSFTSIGEIYGGGYGKTAVVTGDTYVNIDVHEGQWAKDEYLESNKEITFTEYKRTDAGGFEYDDDGNRISEEKTVRVDLPGHAANARGAINTVFGGGNEAKVVGNAKVNIGTHAGEIHYIPVTVSAGDDVSNYYIRSGEEYTEAEGTATEDSSNTYYKQTVSGIDIRGNVYGGGNNAEVTGNTDVVIGKKN